MASIARRAGGSWRARYRDVEGKEHSRHFARKVDAQRWLDETTASIITGTYVAPKAGRITFKAYAEQWRSMQVHRPSTTEHIERLLRASRRCASLLIRHGESVKTVQARLGHKSAQETLDTYAHLWPDSDDRTREAIDSVLGPTADSVRTEGTAT